MSNEYSEAISETLEVMRYMDDELLNKIPLDVIKMLKEQQSKSYNNKFKEIGKIDFTLLSDKAKNVLAVIYRDYIANDEEKMKFDKILYENEMKQSNEEYIIKKAEKSEENLREFLPVVTKKSFVKEIFIQLKRRFLRREN